MIRQSFKGDQYHFYRGGRAVVDVVDGLLAGMYCSGVHTVQLS